MEEYPHRYATLRAHSLIKSKVFTDADLHLIAERTGDVMCYLFFRQAPDGCRSGITLCVNGYACRNLDRLALLTAPVVDTLSDFVLGEGNDAWTEAFITGRLGGLREKLEAATDLGESELSPLDYAIKDDNYISYAWGYADPKAILSSSEQGLTYVRFPGIAYIPTPSSPTSATTAPTKIATLENNTNVDKEEEKKDLLYRRLSYAICSLLVLCVIVLWRQGVIIKEMTVHIDSLMKKSEWIQQDNESLKNQCEIQAQKVEMVKQYRKKNKLKGEDQDRKRLPDRKSVV